MRGSRDDAANAATLALVNASRKRGITSISDSVRQWSQIPQRGAYGSFEGARSAGIRQRLFLPMRVQIREDGDAEAVRNLCRLRRGTFQSGAELLPILFGTFRNEIAVVETSASGACEGAGAIGSRGRARQRRLIVATVQIRNDMPTGLGMWVFGQVTDDLSETPDVVHQHKRFIPVGTVNDIELPGGGAVTQLNSSFWAQWSAQNANADFVRRHLVYQVG
jgi:hypothetical protein